RDQRVEPEPQAQHEDHGQVAAEDRLCPDEQPERDRRRAARGREPAAAELAERAAQLFTEEGERRQWASRYHVAARNRSRAPRNRPARARFRPLPRLPRRSALGTSSGWRTSTT